VTGLAYAKGVDIWKEEGVGRSVGGVLEAGRDGSRGAVACRLAADGEQRDRVMEGEK